MKMETVNEKGAVWVFAEQEEGVLADVSLELLGKGKQLADGLREKLASLLIGPEGTRELANKLLAHGADRVYLAEHPLFSHYQTVPYAKAAVEMIRKYQPQIVLLGASVIGRDLAPRIASTLKAGCTADCTESRVVRPARITRMTPSAMRPSTRASDMLRMGGVSMITASNSFRNRATISGSRGE